MAEQTRDELAQAVAEVWARNNGWIPGGAKTELEEALGLSLPLPATGELTVGGGFSYSQDPLRLSGRETYAEWAARL